jgi:hypothetical protein
MDLDGRYRCQDSPTSPSPTLCSLPDSSVGWAYLEHIDIARLQTRVSKDLLSAPRREVESTQVGKAVRRSVAHTRHTKVGRTRA